MSEMLANVFVERAPEMALLFFVAMTVWKIRGQLERILYRVGETRRILLEVGHARETAEREIVAMVRHVTEEKHVRGEEGA
jgi:hypothetical protein